LTEHGVVTIAWRGQVRRVLAALGPVLPATVDRVGDRRGAHPEDVGDIMGADEELRERIPRPWKECIGGEAKSLGSYLLR
jgi:hypothetical protein